MRIRLNQYRKGSQSCKNLAEALGIKRLKFEGSSFRPRPTDLIINYGSGKPIEGPARIWNKPECVSLTSNKLKFFQQSEEAEGFQTPKFTTDKTIARGYEKCVSRHKLNGHSGEGIEITLAGDEIPDAPLYVEYQKSVAEFRVHVAFGKAFDSARKIKDPDREEPETWDVRSHRNGFIFARNGEQPSDAALRASEAAVRHFGLDFGAVDILVARNGSVYILEINTAPGLEGTTLTNYAEALQKEILNVRTH